MLMASTLVVVVTARQFPISIVQHTFLSVVFLFTLFLLLSARPINRRAISGHLHYRHCSRRDNLRYDLDDFKIAKSCLRWTGPIEWWWWRLFVRKLFICICLRVHSSFFLMCYASPFSSLPPPRSLLMVIINLCIIFIICFHYDTSIYLAKDEDSVPLDITLQFASSAFFDSFLWSVLLKF